MKISERCLQETVLFNQISAIVTRLVTAVIL